MNTLPPETLAAFRDHVRPESRLEQDLPEAGIRMEEVARGLEEEGIEKFIKPYDAVMEAIRKKGAGG